MEKVLTSQALWQDVDPTAEQLDVNVLNTREVEGVTVKDLYFTGRSFGEHKTRVFATVCTTGANSTKPAILLVGDYKQPIDRAMLITLAQRGFTAMSIDYAGRSETRLHTLYCEQVDYCNADIAHNLFYVPENIRDTKLFEYALNTRRAITYLATQTRASSISVMTAGKGIYAGLMVMAVDNRVAKGVTLFGRLSTNYPMQNFDDQLDVDEEELQRRLDEQEKQQMWTAGLAPQTYAPQIKIPVYAVLSANSGQVDLEDSDVSFRRMNDQSRLLIVPTVYDYICQPYWDGVIRWLKGGVAPQEAEVTGFVDEEGNYNLKVDAVGTINKTSIWYSVNTIGKAFNFRKAEHLTRVGDSFVAKLDMFSKQNELTAFALIEGQIATSTALFYEQFEAKKVKFGNNIVFSGTSSQPLVQLNPSKHWYAPDLVPCLEKGYLDIVGAAGLAMATFAVSDGSVRKNGSFAVSFDVCTTVAQQLNVFAVCNFGDTNDMYSCQISLRGDGRWQRVTVDENNFYRLGDGKHIAESEQVEMMAFSAEHKIIINNIVLV